MNLPWRQKSELQNILSGNVRLDIKSDDSLSDGDCWIETPDGSVDADFISDKRDKEIPERSRW